MNTKLIEEWRFISGFDRRYMVSNIGRLKSLEHTVFNSHVNRYYIRPEKMLTPSFSSLRKYKTDRYLMIVLKKEDGVKMTTYIHRLVAIAFVENQMNKPHVNHKDGNTLNNIPDNLEWVTNRENILHAHRNGLVNKALGEKASKAKLTNKQALEIAKSKLPYIELAEIYNVNTSTIGGIKTGRYWSHLTGIKFKGKSNRKIYEYSRPL